MKDRESTGAVIFALGAGGGREYEAFFQQSFRFFVTGRLDLSGGFSDSKFIWPSPACALQPRPVRSGALMYIWPCSALLAFEMRCVEDLTPGSLRRRPFVPARDDWRRFNEMPPLSRDWSAKPLRAKFLSPSNRRTKWHPYATRRRKPAIGPTSFKRSSIW